MLPGWLRLCLCALILCASVGVSAAPGAVVQLQVDGVIGPASADYLVRGLAKAVDEGAQLVVIEIDTPGGLDTAMRAIIKAILASPIPVASYVAPGGARAASAGTYILYASHVAAMTPGTNLGAATPVAIGMPGAPSQPEGDDKAEKDKATQGDKGSGDAMTAKQVNDAAAYIRSLAQLRGRNAAWAERAVREAVSLSAAEAKREHVIDVVAPDIESLLVAVDGREVQVNGRPVKLALAGATVEPGGLRLDDHVACRIRLTRKEEHVTRCQRRGDRARSRRPGHHAAGNRARPVHGAEGGATRHRDGTRRAKSGWRRGLLLPDLEGVDTVEYQINIARQKAGIGPNEPVKLYRFEVVRYK